MAWDLEKLPWLLPAPEDFRARCRALADLPQDEAGRAVAALSRFALDMHQLSQLSGRIAALQAERADLSPLVPLRLAVLGSATTALFVPALAASAARHGIALEVVASGYDQVAQAAMDPGAAIHAARPDAVLLALDYRSLPFAGRAELAGADGTAEAAERLQRAEAWLEAVRDGLRRNSGAAVILQTLAPPPEPEFGNLDALVADGLRGQVAGFNARLLRMAREEGDLVFDVAALACRLGLDRWHDPVRWNLNKLPFAAAAIPLYADQLGRLLGAVRGRYRKCLVLDLDNTVWGGVIGDDGLAGISIGQGSGTGEAFLSVQRMALDLKARGVVLAVCSKNDEAVARQPFREHPDMLLRESDIAVFKAGWGEKAEAIGAIAAALEFGPDALVLLDDNPVERARIREVLPMVAVPELPADPSLYPRALLSAGYFEAIAYSAEDRARADQYAANAQRQELRAESRDLDSFLRSLDMELELAPFDELSRPRVAQLTAKSNQYNLTTRRYSEAEIGALQARQDVVTLQARLRDRFGDNGLIGVVICRHADGDEWEIDTWLMSCRVIGRCVEHAIRDHLAALAKAAGARALTGRFVPSGRNELVRDHYPRLGFEAAGQAGETMLWRLPLQGFVPADLPLRLTGAAPSAAAPATGPAPPLRSLA